MFSCSHVKDPIVIYDELRNYLVTVSDQETVEFFDSAVELFDAYDVPDYLDTLESILTFDSKRTDTEIVDHLKIDTQSILRYLLTMQGIELIDDILPSEIVILVKGMFDLRYYEDQDNILSIIGSEQTSEEAVAELLQLTTPLAIEKTLSLITQVQDGFFTGLKERLKDLRQSVEDEVKDVQVQIKKYIDYKKHLRNAGIYSDRFFAHLGSIGLPFQSYLKLLQNDNLNQGGEFNVAQLAQDLIGLAFLSEDGHDQPLIQIRKHLSSLIGDVNVATKVDIAVSKLVIGVDNA